MQPQDLLNKAKSPKVAFHRFVLLHGKEHSTDLFCFFEGSDSQYYFPRINIYNQNHHPIICGNKKTVFEVYDFIKFKYPTYKTSFFVDSDFDDNNQKVDLYTTCGYSIENFYCTENVINRILKNEFFLKVTDSEYIRLMDLFNKRQKEFHQATSLFNLWYFSAKQKAKTLNQSTNVCLDEKFPKDFISFSFHSITSDYSLQDIKEKFPDAIDVTEEDLNRNKEFFFSKEPTLRFRGKYEIEFIIKYLNFIITDANTTKAILKKKTKFKIDSALVLSQLSQYAETTNNLHLFLNSCA